MKKMVRWKWPVWKWPLCLAALTMMALLATGCSDDDDDDVAPSNVSGDGGAISGTSVEPTEDLTEIASHLDSVLALGYNTTNPDALAKVLFDEDPANDPFILDTREPADYAAGHIPGAVNIPLQDLPRALMNGTSGIPADREVVVASYWGNDGNMASILVNATRIEDPQSQKAALDAKETPPYPKSTALFQGMTSWSFRKDLVPAGTRFDDASDAGVIVQRDTESDPVAGTPQGSYPAFTAFPAEADSVRGKTLIRAHNYLNSFESQFDFQVYPSEIATVLEDGDSSNDPQIVSVRGGAHYAAGHIPGSINIAYKEVAKLTNAGMLDPTRDVVAYCYTGHTGSLSTMALGILGYPVKNLLYGINGWNTNSAIASGQLRNFDLMKGWDFPVNDGGEDDLSSLADYAPPTGCVECHSSLTAIFYDREVANPPLAVVAPPSEGEG